MRALLVVSAALALAAPGADATRINLGDAFGRVTGLISAAVHSHRDAEQSKAPSSPYKGEYIEFPGLRESHTLSPPAHEWVKVRRGAPGEGSPPSLLLRLCAARVVLPLARVSLSLPCRPRTCRSPSAGATSTGRASSREASTSTSPRRVLKGPLFCSAGSVPSSSR